jgi:DNA polymerase-4
MPLRTFFVVFNSYCASVAQQLRPELQAVPIAVLPVLADTTCCIAASYEAKKFGVKTGTTVAETKSLCPAIRLIKARRPRTSNTTTSWLQQWKHARRSNACI